MIQLPAAGAGPMLAPAAPAVDRRRARSRAGWRRRLTVLAFLSPWLVGFSVFFGYPLVMSAWLSLHSYDLLTPKERTLLHRLSVFPGGWTVAAVEEVCTGAGLDRGAAPGRALPRMPVRPEHIV